MSQKLAHGYETDIRKTFDDKTSGKEIYVKGMKIWIRRWDGRPVYGGTKVVIFVVFETILPTPISHLLTSEMMASTLLQGC